MQLIYYTIIGIVALLIHLIINHDILRGRNRDKVQDSYRHFLLALLVYYVIDALWGVFAYTHSTSLLYLDTIAYYTAGAFTVILWCGYVTTYLNVQGGFKKFLKIFGLLFVIFSIVFLAINHFQQIFFSFDENGNYQALPVRYFALCAQVILFGLTTVKTLAVANNSKGARKRRHMTIALFGIVMIAAVIAQAFYPLCPIYTLGFLIGTCVIHIFVQEGEKAEIRNTMEEYLQVITSSGYGIWKFTFDNQGKINGLIGNEKWKEIFGLTGTKMTPEETLEYYNNRLTEKSFNEAQKDYDLMRKGFIRNKVFEWIHPKKGLVYLNAGGTKRIEADGTITISGFIRDVTEEKYAQDRMNSTLERARKQAEDANKAKSAFLVNMSHDIRTPMNAIISFTNILQSNLDDKAKCLDYIKKIQNSSQFLLSLTNNVLEMSHNESGKIFLERNLISTQSFEDMTDDLFTDLARESGLSFSNEYHLIHEYVIGDETKIRELTLNIVGNAIKYTPAGGSVKLSLIEGECDKPGYTMFTAIAEDSGVGISEEVLPHIFDEYPKDSSSSNKNASTGLGLPIVKKILDLMGGDIQIESKAGKGTKVTIKIILEVPTAEQIEKFTAGQKST